MNPSNFYIIRVLVKEMLKDCQSQDECEGEHDLDPKEARPNHPLKRYKRASTHKSLTSQNNSIISLSYLVHPPSSARKNRTATMAAALNKIAATSPSRQNPSELETSIANALYDLESNIPDMKTALRPLQFVSAREVSFF